MTELPETVRAFVAIRVSEEVERAIGELIDELRRPGDGIKWVTARNLHLTLKFLGPSVPIAKIENLKRELEKVAARTAAFEIDAAEVGGFPDLNRPRVLWVGLESPALMELARAVEDTAERCGFEREKRAFSAHLTIARIRAPHGWARTMRALERARERRFGVCRVAEMAIYSSTLAPQGSIYEALATFSFPATPIVEG